MVKLKVLIFIIFRQISSILKHVTVNNSTLGRENRQQCTIWDLFRYNDLWSLVYLYSNSCDNNSVIPMFSTQWSSLFVCVISLGLWSGAGNVKCERPEIWLLIVFQWRGAVHCVFWAVAWYLNKMYQWWSLFCTVKSLLLWQWPLQDAV